MASCVVCLRDSQPCTYVDSFKWKKCNIKPIIEKHLWWWHLKQLSLKGKSYICQQCWRVLLSFHTFYLRVEKTHRQYNAKKWSVLKRSFVKDDSILIGDLSETCNESHEQSSPKLMQNDLIIRIANNNETIELLPNLHIENEANNSTFSDNHTPEYKKFISTAANDKYLKKNARQLLCDICNITSKDFTELIHHFRQAHDIPGYATCCKKNFYNRGQYADHLRVHENPLYFQCTICTKILSQRQSYLRHKKIHKNATKHDRRCGTCKKSFSNEDEYERHIHSECQEETENNKYLAKNARQLLCDICNITSKDFTELIHHFRQAHALSGYATCCKKKFYSRGRYADHLRVHENPLYFQCTICTKILSHRSSYEKHKMIHKKPTKHDHKCDTCKKSFSNKDEYERHILSECQEDNSNGESCDYTENVEVTTNNEPITNEVSSNYFIATHNTDKMAHHPVVKSEQIDDHHLEKSCNKEQSENTETQEPCSVVKLENYTYIDENVDHRNNETNSYVEIDDGPEYDLQTHDVIPKKFYCNMCGKQFASNKLLRRHGFLMHYAKGTEKDLKCPFCSRVSPNMKSHRHHIRVHHTVGCVHACYICGKKFRNPAYLKDHIGKHTGDAPHTCQYCPRTFTYRQNMYAHRKRCHTKQWQEERSKGLAAQNTKKLSLNDSVTTTG